MAAKRAVAEHLNLGAMVVVIPHWLWITYVHNRHGAMGLFGDRQPILIGLALLVLVALVVMLRDMLARSALAQIAFGMIAGGAIGNLIDRIAHGYVIDYIAFRTFYVFNLADACITVAVALLLVDSFVRKRAHA